MPDPNHTTSVRRTRQGDSLAVCSCGELNQVADNPAHARELILEHLEAVESKDNK